MYEVINEELGIKACGIGDLTTPMINSILGQWEDEATIGTLTLFYDGKTGDIVLNKDNKLYESYLSLAEDYLSSSADVRREIRSVCPIPGVKETLDVLEDCVKSREIKRELFILNRQREIEDKYEMPWALRVEIEKEYSFSNPRFWMFKAFQYGVMQGKKIERAKKKRQSPNFGE